MAIFHTEPQSSVPRPAESYRHALAAGAAGRHHPGRRAPRHRAGAGGARRSLTPAEVDAFLKPTLSALHDPLLLPDMAAAVEAIQDALARGARIRIFGDYDADGITATALLVRALSALGGDGGLVSAAPHRRRLRPEPARAGRGARRGRRAGHHRGQRHHRPRAARARRSRSACA